MPSIYFTEEHDEFRRTVRKFLEKEVAHWLALEVAADATTNLTG